MPSPNLSQTQHGILSAAAGRANGAVLPLPASITLRGAARDKVLGSLIRRGLIQERPTRRGAEPRRNGDGGPGTSLHITRTGRNAVGEVPDRERGEPSAAPTPEPNDIGAEQTGYGVASIRTTTKQAIVIGLLRRGGGASVPEIMAATGWQTHSVRGSLSGAVRKKLSLPLVVETDPGGERRYHIAALTETTR